MALIFEHRQVGVIHMALSADVAFLKLIVSSTVVVSANLFKVIHIEDVNLCFVLAL